MEHELQALKTEFAEYKVKEEADFKGGVDSQGVDWQPLRGCRRDHVDA